MDGNKDEALRCVRIAEEAVASGNRDRALKFIRIAQRLNHKSAVSELLAACEKLDSASCAASSGSVSRKFEDDKGCRGQNGRNERSYSEEHLSLIREIRKNKDYYTILGVERSCSVEEIRRAYKKLSLKVHPDKNKAPGSEEAFKKLSKAFKCLSESDSRRQYDRTGLIDEFEANQRYDNVRRSRRRRTNAHEFYEGDFDPNDVFRSFFGQEDRFRTPHVYTSRAEASHRSEEVHGGGGGGGPNLFILLQILPLLFIFILAYLPFSEPEYSLMRNHAHQVPKLTEKHEVEFFVKTIAFDDRFPPGSPARASIEDNVIKDYKRVLLRYCHVELQRRHWNRNLPTPNCDKLHGLGLS